MCWHDVSQTHPVHAVHGYVLQAESMRVPPHNDDAVAPCSGLRFSAALHGESSKRLATPRNTKDKKRWCVAELRAATDRPMLV